MSRMCQAVLGPANWAVHGQTSASGRDRPGAVRSVGTGDMEAGFVSRLGKDWAALLEEVAAEPGSEGLAGVCQTDGVWGWGGRQCFSAARAWRPKGGACLGNRNKSNHAATKKALGSPRGLFWPGTEQDELGILGLLDRCVEPWGTIPGALGLGNMGVLGLPVPSWSLAPKGKSV